MEISYQYVKKRSDFGAFCAFDDVQSQVLESIPSSTDFDADFTPRNPVVSSFEADLAVSEHECNTELVKTKAQGMQHVEGGWPDNIDASEPEQVDRYLKKQSKEAKFKASVKELGRVVEESVRQNNTLDIYERYFEDAEALTLASEPPSMRAVAMFRDPSAVKRSVTAVNWNADGTMVAAAYSVLRFQDASTMEPGFSPNSYVWDLNCSVSPTATLAVPSPLVSVRFNAKTPDILVGGSYNGMVHVFDIKKPRSVAISSSAIDKSHFDPVYDVFWIQSKTNNQFVSVSTDGRMLWWDTRKLSEPTDELVLNDGGRVLGGSALEYNIEAGPAKFLVGTEQGIVMSLNMRKAKAGGKDGKPDNSGAISLMDTGSGKHHGPIYSIQRNPFHPINYMTVGDWGVRIWCDGKNKTPIMTLPYSKAYLSWGAWSPTRAGSLFVTRNDGVLDAWDLFYAQSAPIYSHRVASCPLTVVAPQPTSGRLLAVGDTLGNITLLECSENLTVPPPSEKMAMGLAFERESKREENLEKRALALARAARAAQSKAKAEGGGGAAGSSGGGPQDSPAGSRSPAASGDEAEQPVSVGSPKGGFSASAGGAGDLGAEAGEEAMRRLEAEFLARVAGEGEGGGSKGGLMVGGGGGGGGGEGEGEGESKE